MTDPKDIDYGPLAGLIGTWEGDKGLDVAPEPDGTEESPYYETIIFEPIGDVTNAEDQVLTVLRYLQIVRRKSNDEVFHDQTGYWTWDARLTTTLILFLIYSGYLLARAVGGPNDEQAARYAAVVGLIGYLDVPLIHFSVDWWRTLHPQRIIFDAKPSLPGEMLLVLLVGFIGVLFLMLWLILLRGTTEYLVQRADRLRARLDQLERA